jgi:hypothetical protein
MRIDALQGFPKGVASSPTQIIPQDRPPESNFPEMVYLFLFQAKSINRKYRRCDLPHRYMYVSISFPKLYLGGGGGGIPGGGGGGGGGRELLCAGE